MQTAKTTIAYIWQAVVGLTTISVGAQLHDVCPKNTFLPNLGAIPSPRCPPVSYAYADYRNIWQLCLGLPNMTDPLRKLPHRSPLIFIRLPPNLVGDMMGG